MSSSRNDNKQSIVNLIKRLSSQVKGKEPVELEFATRAFNNFENLLDSNASNELYKEYKDLFLTSFFGNLRDIKTAEVKHDTGGTEKRIADKEHEKKIVAFLQKVVKTASAYLCDEYGALRVDILTAMGKKITSAHYVNAEVAAQVADSFVKNVLGEFNLKLMDENKKIMVLTTDLFVATEALINHKRMECIKESIAQSPRSYCLDEARKFISKLTSCQDVNIEKLISIDVASNHKQRDLKMAFWLYVMAGCIAANNNAHSAQLYEVLIQSETLNALDLEHFNSNLTSLYKHCAGLSDIKNQKSTVTSEEKETKDLSKLKGILSARDCVFNRKNSVKTVSQNQTSMSVSFPNSQFFKQERVELIVIKDYFNSDIDITKNKKS